MTTRVQVRAELLRWARERARLSVSDLVAKFPRLPQWELGETAPTLKQLEAYAKATHASVGYFFLPAPPDEPLPIPDFRTFVGREVVRPSPNLLDTIYACQERQSWYREHAQGAGDRALPFVGSAALTSPVVATAASIRSALAFDLEQRRNCSTWTEALRLFIGQADRAGVMVMCSGVVLNNNRRHLDPDEFRGFALADPLAPLLFINGADSKAAQMFTLAHELAHIWLGASGLSDASVASHPQGDVESWCNRVAAEVLAPLEIVRAELRQGEETATLVARLSRRFKVSSLVVLLRLLDAGRLTPNAFRTAYDAEIERIAQLPRPSGGGDFYLTTAARVSKRFARALVESTVEGRTLYRDAFRMLGIAKTDTFHELGRSLQFGS